MSDMEGNLHELWTWAVGKPGYDKPAWIKMQHHLVTQGAVPRGIRWDAPQAP